MTEPQTKYYAVYLFDFVRVLVSTIFFYLYRNNNVF